jgi:hypothetical protein
MGKRSSTAVAAAGNIVKKAKKTATPRNPEAPIIEEWDRTKLLQKDLRKAAKDELLKDEPAKVQVPGPEIMPTPPAGFQVTFLAFILHGLSFPVHDLTPNMLLHIVCFITLCECFLGIELHWAL